MVYVEVSIAGQHSGRQFYTYYWADQLEIGALIRVPFGKKSAIGIVRAIVKKPTFATKALTTPLNITLPTGVMQLIAWIEQFYPYDYGDISQLFVPPNLSVTAKKAPNQAPHSPKNLPALTSDQANSLSVITQNQHVILHGDTGTGKTRVYLEYANAVLQSGKSVLILTPEIGLTPQLEQDIKDVCPFPIYVTHSQKTPAARRRVWEQAYANESPALFIGPRSSLFLPFNNLGLVVIDEAHDNSYNNFQTPKYNGVYIAAKLAQINSAHFVQSTATPNVSDYAIAQQKRIPISRMTHIAAGQASATGYVIDMTDRALFTQHPLISDPLIAAIKESLRNKEQSLMFLNRRGTARIVQCNNCGQIEECLVCGIPFTYHHDAHRLKCHVCGRQQASSSQCSACGSTDLLYFSPGTKGIEQDIQSLFRGATIARFDMDVAAKDSVHRRLDDIKSGAIDILVGTQLLTKGLDLPRLSTVSIINADAGLSLPDYRAEEITFQQLYQVTGRVGRGHTLSKYFIQTRQPHHPVIEAALDRNWQKFYDYEIHKRKAYRYPPFAYLALITITKARPETAQKHAQAAYNLLAKDPRVTILGPSPSYYETAQGGHTWQLLLKSSSRSHLVQLLTTIPGEWTIDMDPSSVL